MAAQQGNLEVAMALVEANDALSDITNNFGQTAYDIALEKGYMSVANYLSTAWIRIGARKREEIQISY